MDSKAYAKEHKQAFIAMVRHNGSLKSLFLHGTIEEQEVVLNEASRRALIKQQEVIDLAESIDN